MKIQLDTTNKKIKIEEEVNLDEFMKLLDNLLPNNSWKEFTLEVNVINNFSNPIIIREQPYTNPFTNPNPYSPPYYPQVWYTVAEDNKINFNDGVYNLECNLK